MTVQLSSSEEKEVKRLPRSAALDELVPCKVLAEIYRTVPRPLRPLLQVAPQPLNILCVNIWVLWVHIYSGCESQSRASSRDP